MELVDAAPKLPIPKRHNWSSLVHLHGRIKAPGEDGTNLVLTAGDFGQAYLADRWASRFITELFREFTVVFVGYSVGDPVMGYLVDALAAERERGARFAAAYAFAPYDGSDDTGKTEVHAEWKAKNVEPILYDDRDDHRLLDETLISWANVREDPLQFRFPMAIDGMKTAPPDSDDPVAERVAWALDNPITAKALVDLPPITDETEFEKFGIWLDRLTEQGLLSRVIDSSTRINELERDILTIRLVDNGFRAENPYDFDMTRNHLSTWIAKHLHVPQLLTWALRNGGYPHPRLRHEIEEKLSERNPDIRILDRLRFLWTVFLAHRNSSADPWKGTWAAGRYKEATGEPERRLIEREVVEHLAPRLAARPGHNPYRSKPASPVEACAHLKLVFSGDNSFAGSMWRKVRDVLTDASVLARHAETLTSHLEQAVELTWLKDGQRRHRDSSLYRASIAPHKQNRGHDDDVLALLIDLARDSYMALADRDRRRAATLLMRWTDSGTPLLARLALHALTEKTDSDIGLVGDLIVKGKSPGLWNNETRREVMRFFRKAGHRLPQDVLTEIVSAIHAGPEANEAQSGLVDPEMIRRRQGYLLRKLTEAGVELDRQSQDLITEVETGDTAPRDGGQEEFRIWWTTNSFQPVDIGDLAPRKLVEGTVADIAAAMDAGKIDPDSFRGLTKRVPVKVADALCALAEQERWPASYWPAFLGSLSFLSGEDEPPPTGLRDRMAAVLAGAPDSLFEALGADGAEFTIRIGEEYGPCREGEFVTLWRKVWRGMKEAAPDTNMDDPLTNALNHPAGKLAEAMLARMRQHQPEADAGIPEALRGCFDAICSDARGNLGRVMLASRLYYLFMIDPGWTGRNLIARFHDPQGSQEAADLWSGYGYSPGRCCDSGLLAAFKEAFLDVLRTDWKDGNLGINNLKGLFISICLDTPGDLTEEEIDSVVGQLSEKGLCKILWLLANRLQGSPEERALSWKDQVHPWLGRHWPPSKDRQTQETSESIMRLLSESGTAFPEAAEWAADYLKPTNGRDLYLLDRNGLAALYPCPMLHVLDLVVDENILQGWAKSALTKVLDAIAVADERIREKPLFRRLYRIAVR